MKSSKMYHSSKVLLLLIKLCLLHFSVFTQSNLIVNQIKDTTELNNAINLLDSALIAGEEIDRSKLTTILESSLKLKDTLTFFKVCYAVNYDYFLTKRLNKEGILFVTGLLTD